MSKAKHKDTFFQDYSDEGINIPSHWVVQFYIEGSDFPEAAYFKSRKEAAEFEDKLIKDGEIDDEQS